MRIGITGHQRLPDLSVWKWVEIAMDARLNVMPAPLIAVSSLAIGADQLLSRLVLQRGGELIAILPYEGIERSFSTEDVVAYRELVSKAKVETLSTPGSDEDRYLAAGQRVVNLSDLVFAVWNGEPAKGKGGTADIIEYARSMNRRLVIFNPSVHSVSEG
jgi:hypothetical protein